MRPVLILFSGGADSSYLMSRSPEGSVGLFVSWGQPTQREEQLAVTRIGEALGRAVRFASVAIPIGAMGAPSTEPGPRVVPGRNLALIAVAVSHAAALGFETVQIGAANSDRAEYPDCSPAFVAAVSAMTTAAYGVSVEAPLLSVPRADVLAATAHLRPWSCYRPLVPYTPCGGCNACLRSQGEAAASALLAMTGGQCREEHTKSYAVASCADTEARWRAWRDAGCPLTATGGEVLVLEGDGGDHG